MLYWGFDFGDGESTVARVDGGSRQTPEVVEIDGKKVVITAWAVMKNGEIRIGENAARSAASSLRSAARFKSRFLDPQSDAPGLIRDFSAKILETLRSSGELTGGENSNCFYIGCPAGWDREARERYRGIFVNLGCPAPQVISESRAVMVGAVQSNSVRDYVDLRSKSVLVVDIGSSTTDFAYIHKGRETEIRTGGEVALGGGVMDEVLLEACVDASPDAAGLRRVFAESEAWRVDCELHARRLKEAYYSDPASWEETECRDARLISYDEPLLLDLYMDAAMAKRLTDRPCRQLGGRSFREVFCAGLREVRSNIGEAQPELLFLTGGVSRMAEIRDWCREVFPAAVVYSDREPEFSVARGLAWCGHIDDELRRFRAEVDRLIDSELVEKTVSDALPALYEGTMDNLLDPILRRAVKPVLIDWRDGRIETLAGMEKALQEKIKVYLYSEEAKGYLFRPVREWMRRVSEELEGHTAEICRNYHVPAHSLEISSSLSAADLHILEKVDAGDVLAGDGLAGAAVLVESIVSVLIGLLCGGGGVALIAEGPIGIVAGIVISIVVLSAGHVLGKKVVDQKLMEANLPLAVRRMALARSLPKLEPPELSLPNPLKKVKQAAEPEALPAAEPEAERPKLRLLPRLRWADEADIPEKRMKTIRNKISANYRKKLSDPEGTELRELNRKMCGEISDQIEQRLKELAEQVEIPL